MQLRDINAPKAPLPASPYSQAVEVTGATRTLYLSGQVGAGPDGNAPDVFEEQAELVWRNIAFQLEEAGMTFDNLVKVTTIITDRSNIPASREARLNALGDRKPASTLIIGGLASLDWLIEIEGVAVA
jgi:enamine deaminase RidA (YjgF/YER057c/UK114 family)